MWWNEYGHASWMFFFGPTMLLVAMIVCVAVVSSMLGRHGRQRGGAADILKERYARGEIGDEEYEKRRRVVES